MKLLTLLSTLTLGFALSSMLHAEEPGIYSVPLKDIDGKDATLKAHSGKAMLIVNVASQCGNTKQYAGLESLFRKYKDKGLVVLGFPCNDFGSQEPGTNLEIKEFCTAKFDVSFPMYDKLHVKGAGQHPLYTVLSGPASPFPGPVKWNFGKFLVGRDGKVLKRFEPGVQPDSVEVTDAIEAALAAK